MSFGNKIYRYRVNITYRCSLRLMLLLLMMLLKSYSCNSGHSLLLQNLLSLLSWTAGSPCTRGERWYGSTPVGNSLKLENVNFIRNKSGFLALPMFEICIYVITCCPARAATVAGVCGP